MWPGIRAPAWKSNVVGLSGSAPAGAFARAAQWRTRGYGFTSCRAIAGAGIPAAVAVDLQCMEALERSDTLSGLMSWTVVPNFKKLGPRLGRRCRM